jgi:hypothetical protein
VTYDQVVEARQAEDREERLTDAGEQVEHEIELDEVGNDRRIRELLGTLQQSFPAGASEERQAEADDVALEEMGGTLGRFGNALTTRELLGLSARESEALDFRWLAAHGRDYHRNDDGSVELRYDAGPGLVGLAEGRTLDEAIENARRSIGTRVAA